MSEEEYKIFKSLDMTNQLWKIYQLLSEKSKLVVTQEITQKYDAQDFKGVTVMGQTDKSLLVVKNGLQQFLARQFIYNPEDNYQDGQMYDVILKEKSDQGKPTDWVKSKWTPFVPYKGGNK